MPLYFMEEYSVNPIKAPEETDVQDLTLKHSTSLGGAVGVYRHVSVTYGVEFQSKVSLYAKERSSCQNEIAIESIPKETLFKKVINFIEKAHSNPKYLEGLLTSFTKLGNEMKLSVRKSRQSILTESSQQSWGSGDGSSFSGNKKPLVELSKSSSPAKENGGSLPKLKKAKTSVMSKVNRISLADAINVTELQNLKVSPIEAIPSSESFQSQSSQSLNQFNSRGDLKSDPSQTASNKESMTSLNKALKLPRNKKISIMVMDEFSSGSDIFSEEDIVSLTDLKVAEVVVSQALLENYFDFYSPFLVNLGLCLMVKSLTKNQIGLTKENAGWLLGIATVIAYKVYYDEPIDGLMQFFSDTLSMPTADLLKLQRWFLYRINYELVVSTEQYQHLMFELLSQKDNIQLS